jgi:hypothetical protein
MVLAGGVAQTSGVSTGHRGEGTPNFDLVVLPIRGVTSESLFTLGVLAACFEHYPEGIVDVAIELPQGLDVVEGDVKRRFGARELLAHARSYQLNTMLEGRAIDLGAVTWFCLILQIQLRLESARAQS